jgi:hypothetical protein
MSFEVERQNELTKARENHVLSEGETIEMRFGPGTFGYHELLDRANLMLINWESFIVSHPATLLDPERYEKAQLIVEAMADFYQVVGAGDCD